MLIIPLAVSFSVFRTLTIVTMSKGILLWCVLVAFAMVNNCVSLSTVPSRFDELYQPTWAMDHFVYQGDLIKMRLDNFSGIFAKLINISFFLSVPI